MIDETKDQEPIEEESAPQQEERAPEQAADAEVEEEPKETPDKKALREARRDAKKAARKAARLEKELERRSRMGPSYGPSPTTEDPQARAQIIEQQAMAYRQMEQDRFIGETLERLSLERDDRRIDYSSPETFLASAAVARQDDLEDREAELAEKEEKLESLGERLRAEAKEALEQEIRDFRRAAGLDAVAKVTPTGERGVTEADIREKYRPQLEALRGRGSTGEVMVLIREMEAEIAEAQSA